MSRPTIDPASTEWLNGRQSCQALKCGLAALQRAALLGQVRTRLAPGEPVRYSKIDVERLAEARKGGAAGTLQLQGA